MPWPFRKKPSTPPPEQETSSARQQWNRTPGPLDAVGGYMPDLEKVDKGKPGEIYPDEIDPAWADTGDGEPADAGNTEPAASADDEPADPPAS